MHRPGMPAPPRADTDIAGGKHSIQESLEYIPRDPGHVLIREKNDTQVMDPVEKTNPFESAK